MSTAAGTIETCRRTISLKINPHPTFPGFDPSRRIGLEMLMYFPYALRFDGQESECRGAIDGESGDAGPRLVSHSPEALSACR